MGLPVITITSPTSGFNSTSPVVFFDVTYTDPVNSLVASSVVFEIDSVNTFDSPGLKTISYATIAAGKKVRTFPNLINGSYFWRVSITNATGTTISSVYPLTVSRVINRVLYQYENIGIKLNRFTNKRIIYQYENIGVKLNRFTNKRTLYQYENIVAFESKRRMSLFI